MIEDEEEIETFPKEEEGQPEVVEGSSGERSQSKRRPGTALVTPAHGRGKLRTGGPNLAGPGALPGRIRASLRTDFEERLAFLRTVVDGGLVQRIAFHVNDLTPYVQCATCTDSVIVPRQVTRNRDAGRVEVTIEASASPKDRLNAMDMMAKYGIGTLKEVSTETVRGKVAETLQAIRKECDPETTERLYVLLREVWK